MQTISLTNIILVNFIFLSTKSVPKLYIKFNIIEQKIDFIYYDIVYLCKNIILAFKNYCILGIDSIKLIFNSLNFVNNLYLLIINYKAINQFT